jgi:hypothetical protein
MAYPPLKTFQDATECEQYYKIKYCAAKIISFDNIRVYFPSGSFRHAFYTSKSRRSPIKDLFSYERAERIDWILMALQDVTAELFCGWDNKKKRIDGNRRVAVVVDNYVVVIQMTKPEKAIFITAFVADQETIDSIKSGIPWKK